MFLCCSVEVFVGIALCGYTLVVQRAHIAFFCWSSIFLFLVALLVLIFVVLCVVLVTEKKQQNWQFCTNIRRVTILLHYWCYTRNTNKGTVAYVFLVANKNTNFFFTNIYLFFK